jgi:hypothetical protein
LKNNDQPRRRWITIGPGIILAAILALQIVSANRQKPAAPPIIERQVEGSARQGISPAPTVSYILDRKGKLKLSPGQVKHLSALEAEWASQSGPLVKDMDKAAREFNAFMKKSGNKATLKDLQAHAASVSVLSGQLSGMRRVYWEHATSLLDKTQIKIVKSDLSAGYTPADMKGAVNK